MTNFGYHGNQPEFFIFIVILVVYLMKEENGPSLRKIYFFCVQVSM